MDPRQVASLHEKASEHYVRGEYAEAVAAWKQLLLVDPHDEKAQEGVRMSSLLADSTDELPDFPAPTFPEDEPREPDGLMTRLHEVELRIEAGDFHGAIRSAEELCAEHADDPDVLSTLAQAYAAAGDSERAAETTAKLLSLDPAYAEAAKLLEECRQVSPPQSTLGMVVLRDGREGEPEALLPGEADLLAEPRLAPPAPVAEQAARGRANEYRPPPKDHSSRREAGPGGPDAPAEAQRESVPSKPAPAPQGESRSEDPAAAALKQRVSELWVLAKGAAAKGEDDEALGLLSRLLILDERNQDAMALEEEVRARVENEARKIQEWVEEGARCFDEGRIEEARQLFLKTLERAPTHREALVFLERVDHQLSKHRETTPAVSASRGAAELGEPASTPSAAVAVPQSGTPEPEPFDLEPGADYGDLGSEPQAAQPAQVHAPAAPSRRSRFHLPGRRAMLLGAAGIGLLTGCAVLAWWLSRPGDSPAAEASVAAPRGRSAPAAGNVRPDRLPGPKSKSTGEPVTPPRAGADDAAKRVVDEMARGERAMAAGRYDAAILAFDSVLGVQPDHEEARRRLLDAGEAYRRGKADTEQFGKARRAFETGEYESALRMFYRLPEGTVDASRLGLCKAAGWYNLGLIALRAADCGQAVSHFAEAAALLPADPEVRRARTLAAACQSRRKDRAYYDIVESLPFRDLSD